MKHSLFLTAAVLLSAGLQAANFSDWPVRHSTADQNRRAVYIPLTDPGKAGYAVYAKTYLYSPVTQNVKILFKGAELNRLLLNGSVLKETDQLSLNQGWNVLLIRCASKNSNHGFQLGIEPGKQVSAAAAKTSSVPAAGEPALVCRQNGKRISFQYPASAVLSFQLKNAGPKKIIFNDHDEIKPEKERIEYLSSMPQEQYFDLSGKTEFVSGKVRYVFLKPDSFLISKRPVSVGNLRKIKPDSIEKFQKPGPEETADKPELWTPAKPLSASVHGRPYETFSAPVRKAWGYKFPQNDTFIVIHPKNEQKGIKYPLYVILHSAGHDVFSTVVCMYTPGNHDIYHSPENFYALVLDCRANGKNDWWWGTAGKAFKEKPDELTPVEKRVMDTIAWTKATYPVDSERVYLSGNSMGGSGTLGIGMNHGDVFAAIKANVPAHIHHAGQRLYFGSRKAPAGFRIPDPPVCVDYSAQNDNWSDLHEEFYQGMQDHKYMIFGYWGMFGHANNHSHIKKTNDLIDSFDWLSVRLHDPYPAFTNAASDDPLPWPKTNPPDSRSGQRNAWFRWQNLSDTAERFEISLYLVSPDQCKTRFTIPEQTTADITMRRMQKFSVKPGNTVKWSFGNKNGSVSVGQDGLVTIPALTVARTPQTLVLTK